MCIRIVWVAVCACGLVWGRPSLVVADKPAGVGSNLHRSFMIQRAQRRAARGLSTPRHVGIWVAGGYDSTVYGRGNPYLHGRTVSPYFLYDPATRPYRTRTLWDRCPVAEDYQNPFVAAQSAESDPQQPVVRTSRPLIVGELDRSAAARLQQQVAALERSFRNGAATGARGDLDRLLREFPDQPEAYQLAALERFQEGDYTTASALSHTALSGGRIWNWQRLRSLYPAREDYTAQLRGLEAAIAQQPREPALRFLLAVHYLMLGHDQAAAGQFDVLQRQLPEDRLTAAVLATLTVEKRANETLSQRE